MSAKLKRQLQRVESKPPGERRLAEFKVACAYGKFGITKAYELIAAGKIAAYKDGRKSLVDLDSIDAYHRSLPRLIMGGNRSGPRKNRHSDATATT